METNIDEEIDISDIVANPSDQLFSWCGYDLDVRTLDVYFNYEKYFESSTSLKTRFYITNDYRNAFVSFNSRFLRIFAMNLLPIVIDSRVNTIPAILRNYTNMFYISAVRFLILSENMPQQVTKN